MPPRLTVEPHLTLKELKKRYRTTTEPTLRSHYHMVWLVADGRTVTREHAGPYTRPDPDPRPARRVGCRLRTRVSNANVEVFEPRPGPREGRRRGCFSAGRANNRAWRRRALREENPKPDANASSRRQVSRRKGIVQKTHLCGGACAASGCCCPEVAMA